MIPQGTVLYRYCTTAARRSTPAIRVRKGAATALRRNETSVSRLLPPGHSGPFFAAKRAVCRTTPHPASGGSRLSTLQRGQYVTSRVRLAHWLNAPHPAPIPHIALYWTVHQNAPPGRSPRQCMIASRLRRSRAFLIFDSLLRSAAPAIA